VPENLSCFWRKTPAHFQMNFRNRVLDFRDRAHKFRAKSAWKFRGWFVCIYYIMFVSVCMWHWYLCDMTYSCEFTHFLQTGRKEGAGKLHAGSFRVCILGIRFSGKKIQVGRKTGGGKSHAGAFADKVSGHCVVCPRGSEYFCTCFPLHFWMTLVWMPFTIAGKDCIDESKNESKNNYTHTVWMNPETIT